MDGEIELKLELDPADIGLLRDQLLPRNAPNEAKHLVSVYYDTPRSKLRKAGYSLRVRKSGDGFVQTVKSLDTGAGLFARGEWESDVSTIKPDPDVMKATPLGPIEPGNLRPVAQTDIDRTSFSAQENGSMFELSLDQGSVSAGDNELPLAELEIELLHGRPEDAAVVARRIAKHAPVKIAVRSKAERGFALADGAMFKCSKARPISLTTKMTAAEGLVIIAQACLKQFRLNEPLVIELREAEALHQARVAMRRLRSAFSLFKPALRGSEFRRLNAELRRFINKFGDARNLDVFLKRDDLTPSDRRRARRRRERAYDRTIRALESRRARLMMIDLVAWIETGKWRDRKKACKPLAPFMDKRIDALWEPVREAKGRLGKMDATSRHHLRIRVKKLRYALEFAQSLHQGHPAGQTKFAKAIEELQEVLGHVNDLTVARKLERQIGGPRPGQRKLRHYLRDAGKALRELTSVGPYWRVAKARRP